MDASPLPVRPMLLQRGDVRLVALDFGGEGPAALLLHGLAGYAGEWVVTARWLTAAAAHIVDAAPGRRATSNCIIEGWVVAAVAALAPPIRAARSPEPSGKVSRRARLVGFVAICATTPTSVRSTRGDAPGTTAPLRSPRTSASTLIDRQAAVAWRRRSSRTNS